MAISPVANDPRHYQSRDGRILPVGGTHVKGARCDTCSFIPTRAVHFAIGQRVEFAYGRRGRVRGVVSKVGRSRVRVIWTSTTGKRHESIRSVAELLPASQSLVQR